ncbi:hypothetical protein HELRODRAFT_181889 [Helobdella robusta]|uniref:C2H2-type domain-containing protein n=1 Tax=Helobdella robusta TaxID=6412 RepID=T1FHF6_HELRO|nr:hypothetical protein HELRODRAFT_181889 [Helobdella robusta]ESN91965.1 hypothetical protein HELRODRAFT_181889 [Helobdella robusta]
MPPKACSVPATTIEVLLLPARLGVNPVKNLARIAGYEDKTAVFFFKLLRPHWRPWCDGRLLLMATAIFVSCQGDKAALFRDVLLSPTGEGTKKSVLNKASQYVADLVSLLRLTGYPTMRSKKKKNFKFSFMERPDNVGSWELFVLGDFNARVGKDHILWPKVLGRNGVGRENSNGTMLLEFCTEHNLVVTNTVFQQADRKKTSWKHPRSGHWHLIDYILIRRRDLRLARLTKAVQASTMWSDHRLIKMSVFLTVKPARIAALVGKRGRRKQVARHGNSTGVWVCGTCGRRCSSRIGLFSHQRTHQ